MKPEISDAIQQIYDAGAGMASWEDTMRGVSDLLASAGVVIYEFDPFTGDIPYLILSPELRGILPEYNEHYVHVDPRVEFAAKHPEVTLLCDYDHIDEQGINNSEYYGWTQAAAGIRYYMGWRSYLGEGLQLGVTVQRTAKQGHAQASQIEIFSELAPHFVRANNIRRQLGELEQQRNSLAGALDRNSRAVIVIDKSGGVRFANRTARKLAAAGDGIILSSSGLALSHGRANARLRKALSAALEPKHGEPITGSAINVPRPSGLRPFVLQIIPLSTSHTDLNGLGPLALLVVSDPAARPVCATNVLRQLFGLTPAEARLAAEMATGDSLEILADRLEVTRETARTTLKRVFAKTETHRQAELVHLLLSLP